MMKKIGLSFLVIFGFAGYAFYQQVNGSKSNPMMIPDRMMAQIINNSLKDGQYTGDVSNAYYGNVQVKAVIAGGKITDIQFLDYPHDRQTSVEINTQAMPLLKTEAIQNQTATVDIISGATQTSLAFRESLQSALNQAK